MNITIQVSPTDVVELINQFRSPVLATQILNQIMIGLDNLTAAVNSLGEKVTTLQTAVDAAVADINASTPTDAQLNTLSQTVDALTAAIGAQADRLNAAVTPSAEA